MANGMDKDVLGKALADLVISPSAPADKQASILQMWTDIADAIISHIQDYGQVKIAPGVTFSTSMGTGTVTQEIDGTIS